MDGKGTWGAAASDGFSAGWDARSYLIAQRLQERGEWESYLTPKELPWVTRALESPELWRQFISPQPEQWRLRALPSAAFETAAGDGYRAEGPATGAAATPRSRQPSEPRSSAGNSGAGDGGSKRAAPDSDGDGDGEASMGEKRARTDPLALESDEDVLSVLSGSDIDMGMWLGGSTAASNAVSPEPAEENGSRPSAAAATAAASSRTTDVDAAEKSLICAAAAFHARAAIFEHYAAVLCDTGECSMCTNLPEIWADVRHVESVLRGPARNGGPGENVGDKSDGSAQVPSLPEHPPQASLLARSVDEDEDYDDGEESDAGATSKGDSASKSVAVDKAHSAEQADDAARSIDMVVTPAVKDASAGAESRTRSIVLREAFHTLDELEDVAHEHREHVAHVEQIRGIADQRAAAPKDMLANKIGALQNMKNLAQFIDKHRDSVSMSTRELSSLLSEVRPKRSKWANERRVGQVDLYEALEHVLNELKAMGEAALPFLNQVKRKDAPDYHKVIKRPMDLGLIAKHLRNEAYNSKRQFADHLQLIRDNCYTYNTEPNNYYRQSADALMARAAQLMEGVPDIVIQDRAGGAEDPECGDESGSESQRTGYGLLREGSMALDDGTPAPADYSVTCSGGSALMRASTDEQCAEATGAGEVAVAGEDATPGVSALAQTVMRVMATDGLSRSAIAEVADGYEQSLAERVWRSSVRQELCARMEQLGVDARSSFGERHAAQRTGVEMRAFLASTHDARERICEEDVAAVERLADTAGLRTVYAQGGADAAEARRRNEALDARRSEWLALALASEQKRAFVGECAVAAGVSQLEALGVQARRRGVARWLDDDCEEPVAVDLPRDALPSVEAYAAARFPESGMWPDMADNLERLRTIREVDDRIWATKLNSSATYRRPVAEERKPGVRTAIRDIHGDYARRPDPPQPLELRAPAARQLLQRAAAFMLAHTGFDAASAAAMACLTDFFADYIANVGRTLRCYRDRHSRTMSTEAIVAHSLYANGTEDLADLEYYMRGEIPRYGAKLGDLHRRLLRSHREAAGGGRPVGDGEVDDAFVAGMSGGLAELGDDFFGFKELGLDKELGVEHLAVPQRLWTSRGANVVDADTAVQEVLLHPLPVPWTPIVGPQGHIGLLHDFIADKLRSARAEGDAGAADGAEN
ncbi:Transcriptional activator spt7, partial [Coemansia biformis]